VLRLGGEGKPNAEIGVAVFISTNTASVHVTTILGKLGVGTHVQAATVAERTGLFAPRHADH
jgi:DNA-binding CsgD family transcriptional regulator